MSIKNLQEIATLVTDLTQKNRFVELVDDENGGPKYLQLMKGLASNKWQNEDEAKLDLYGNKLGVKTFDMLKSRAKEQLVNLIFKHDTLNQFKSSYDKAYFLCCKNLTSGAILILRNRLNSGLDQLKLSLKMSQHYQFTDLEVVTLRILRNISASIGKKKKFETYNLQLKMATEKLKSELEAEELNQELVVELFSGIELTDNWKEQALKNYIKLQKINEKQDTYATRLSMYRVGIRYYDSIYDYKNAIRLATECESYFHENPHLIQKVRLAEMNLQKLYGALHLRDYHNGSKYAESCMELLNPGTLNWLIFLEYYFLLSLHTKNYSKANEIYSQVINHKVFKSYPPQNKEKWKIFESFLAYTRPENEKIKGGFNVARFLNEVPLYSKDKAGYNLSIIVAQIILSLKIGDYSKIVERAEALKLYASRYIRKEKNPRSYYFIKMLMVMIKYDFDPVKTNQIANKFFVKLKEAHLGEVSELESLEVIPYDLLWPEILERLNQTE